MDNIEIIYDELKRNQIHIDKHALSFHINRILNQNTDIYSQIHILDIEQLYREINITNFGRTVAYLACVYLQSEDEETVRRNIRRCVGNTLPCTDSYICLEDHKDFTTLGLLC